MSEFAANPADVAEQDQELDGDPEQGPGTGSPSQMPEDANEADALEQAQEVPEDDEDYRE